LGLLIGVLPRACPLMGIHSSALPITFIWSRVGPGWGLRSLAPSMLVGSCGGAISAIFLVRIPGRHWAAATCWTAYPMRRIRGFARIAVVHLPFQPPRLGGVAGGGICTDLSATACLGEVCFGFATSRRRSRWRLDGDFLVDRARLQMKLPSKGIMDWLAFGLF